MTFLFRWNDSTEQRASQGQCAWWLTKDCLWFDTVISAHKGTDIYLLFSTALHHSSYFSPPTLFSHLHFLSALCSFIFLFAVCLWFPSSILFPHVFLGLFSRILLSVGFSFTLPATVYFVFVSLGFVCSICVSVMIWMSLLSFFGARNRSRSSLAAITYSSMLQLE